MISRWAVSLAGCAVVRMRPREALARETLRLGVVAVNRYFASHTQRSCWSNRQSHHYFLPTHPLAASGLAHRLNPRPRWRVCNGSGVRCGQSQSQLRDLASPSKPQRTPGEGLSPLLMPHPHIVASFDVP